MTYRREDYRVAVRRVWAELPLRPDLFADGCRRPVAPCEDPECYVCTDVGHDPALFDIPVVLR